MIGRTPHIRAVLAGLMAFAAAVTSADAQKDPREPATSIFENVSRWLSILGEKTEDLIAPRFGRVGDMGEAAWAGLKTSTAEFQQTYPVRPDCKISIARDFGEGSVTVKTWENPVVQVAATVAIGAEQQEVAAQIAEAVKVSVTPSPDFVEVRATYPDTRDKGKIAIKMDFEVTAPAGAAVICKNDWGDTTVVGVNGGVTIDSRFGALDLRDIGGPVRVRAWGEFPLRASGLRQGGEFELQGTRGEFATIAGGVKISSFMGSIVIRDPAAESQLDVTSESGPIEVFVPEHAAPDIAASAVFGSIKSDFPLDQTTRGDFVLARRGNVETRQRMTLHVSFDNITIHQEGRKPAEAPAVLKGSGEYIRRSVEQPLTEVPPGAEIVVKAILGDIKVTGYDSDRMQVRAEQIVQMRTNANAQAAIEALSIRVETLEGRVLVTTSVRDNMEVLGCTHYRVDLQLLVPRSSPVRIVADNGFTSVIGMDGPIAVEQNKGRISVEQINGGGSACDLSIQTGEVSVLDSVGPITITVQQGSVRSIGVAGRQVITTAQGRAILESPKGEVVLRNRGGDVSILALDGILGSYNVTVERGTLNIVIPPTSDATLWVNAKNGEINSRIPLAGSIDGEARSFTGKLGAGQHSVELNVDSGAIYID
ncbi:MAG: hypothetical protein AMXMBFR4_29500 [Candidatus Hydrogenedentota bacterium]